MSNVKRVLTVGASARKSDVQRISDLASSADDRALEVAFTPGAAQKAVMPLSEESATVNPRLLIAGQDTDGTVPNAKVRVRPAHFKAGVSGDAYSIALAASLKANTDSPTIGNNSSGSTRTDLLYATISYQTTKTESVRVKPPAGGDPTSQTLTTETSPTVSLAIVANVASGNPLASLPVDDTVNGVYNFGLAALSIVNGYAGGAINQSAITPLWTGAFIRQERVNGSRPMSIFTSAINEKIANVMSSRIGGDRRFMGWFKSLSTTGATVATGAILDNSIDWRGRLISGWISYLGSANGFQMEAAGEVAPVAAAAIGPGHSGSLASGVFATFSYNGGANIISLATDNTGRLVAFKNAAAPVDAANGDVIAIMLQATDRLLTTT